MRAVLVLSVLALVACATAPPPGPVGLPSSASGTVTYRCADGTVVRAVFPAGAMPVAALEIGGRRVVLPRVPAGSGTKYSDEHTVFWTKGDEATFEEPGRATTCRVARD